MKDVLIPDEGIGNEVFEFVRSKLDLPERLIELDLHFEQGEPITYKMTAYATSRDETDDV